MIVCDLDGTLISRAHKISTEDQQAIAEARRMGLEVTVCTGRSTRESLDIIAPLELTGEGVFVTGAAISSLADGHTRVARGLAPELVAELVDFFAQFGHAVLLLVDTPAPGNIHYVITSHGPIHAATEEWLLRNKMQATLLNEKEACQTGVILRAGIVVNLPQSPRIVQELDAKFAERASFLALRAPLFDCHVIEVFAADVNKWTGVKCLCQRMGIAPESVVTIGDDVNDMSMLRGAALSFAMDNAAAEVKAAAKRTTLKQSESGVAAAIAAVLKECDAGRG